MRHGLFLFCVLGLLAFCIVNWGRREEEPQPDLPTVTVDMSHAVVVYHATTNDMTPTK